MRSMVDAQNILDAEVQAVTMPDEYKDWKVRATAEEEKEEGGVGGGGGGGGGGGVVCVCMCGVVCMCMCVCVCVCVLPVPYACGPWSTHRTFWTPRSRP
jgi:hypothetical protein